MNTNLHAAKAARNDEFYTTFRDVEREMMSYVLQDPDVFRGKTVLLPADDPEWSAFTKFFAVKFDDLGLKALISTSYNPGGRGRVFRLDRDINGDKRRNIKDLRSKALKGDGNFASDEVTALRDEADFVITNPPFSLFRDFLAWAMEGGTRKVALIGPINSITAKNVWPLIQSDRLWLGHGFANGNAYYTSPDAESHKQYDPKVGMVKFRNHTWFTNIDHGRRHEPTAFMTMSDNQKYNGRIKGTLAYQKYDNYDAIEVPRTDAIPSDYKGVMGVPVSFLDKHSPDQFEIVGCSYNYGRPVGWDKSVSMSATIDGTNIYKRIFIKHRKPASTKRKAA